MQFHRCDTCTAETGRITTLTLGGERGHDLCDACMRSMLERLERSGSACGCSFCRQGWERITLP